MAGLVAGLVVAALIPLLFLGPGTDLDAGFVLRSARGIVDHLKYHPSRPPGAPVHELAVGLLDAIGGIALANLGSLLMACLCAVSLFALARREGIRHPLLTAAVVVANPWFLIAATSLADFVWALGFLLASAWALRTDHPWRAGVLAALAIGCRAPTVVLVAAVVLAEAWGSHDGDDGGEGASPSWGSAQGGARRHWRDGSGREGASLPGRRSTGRRRALILGGVSLGLGALFFLPPFVDAGGSLSFARNDFRTSSLFVSAGRFAAKDLYLFGPLAAVVLLVAVPSVVRTLRRWPADWLVRFAASGLLLSQILFFRFPWKMGHLLPSLVCIALLVGVAVGDKPRLLYAFVALQLLYGAVRIQVIAPDRPNQATSAHLQLGVGWGPLITDVRCRAKYQDNYASANRGVRERPWNCAAPFGSAD